MEVFLTTTEYQLLKKLVEKGYLILPSGSPFKRALRKLRKMGFLLVGRDSHYKVCIVALNGEMTISDVKWDMWEKKWKVSFGVLNPTPLRPKLLESFHFVPNRRLISSPKVGMEKPKSSSEV